MNDNTLNLVERLRHGSNDCLTSLALREEAATTIEAQAKEIEALREEASDWRELYADAFADRERLDKNET